MGNTEREYVYADIEVRLTSHCTRKFIVKYDTPVYSPIRYPIQLLLQY